jgi:transglutaminase-like putative cysteine protease
LEEGFAMKSRRTFVVAFLAFAAIALVAVVWSGISGFSQARSTVRSFEFTYVTRIPALPADAKISRIWIPVPNTDAYQAISDLNIESPFPYVIHHDSEYGNAYLYLDVSAAKLASPAEVRIHFQVLRREHRVSLDAQPAAMKTGAGAGSLQRFLQPDRRVPLQGLIGELSAQETRGILEPLAKARAIYDYVIATMRYDKSGTGWGNGDAIWACTAKRGNCTDFHSLFIGMMRAAGIPARFEIGFPLPEEQHAGAIPGYHCWAEFYVEPYGWIPVDASEAWKHPEKKDYFFGANDDNRVQFSVGRDIRLSPSQQGEPLNYFIYPYAELDGKPEALESKFSFQDRESSD